MVFSVMCAIIFSPEAKQFLELVKLNQPRGQYSHSHAHFKPSANHGWDGLFQIKKDLGPFLYHIGDSEGYFHIGHCQAPTGGLQTDSALAYKRIHPAQFRSSYLYHNGIIKDLSLDQLNQLSGITEKWDTKALLNALETTVYEKQIASTEKMLSSIDGSFACLYLNLQTSMLWIFRSAAAILYWKDLTISSTEFKDSTLIPADTIYQLDFQNKKWEEIGHFISKSNPYDY